MHQTTTSIDQTGKTVKTILALTPVTATTFLKIFLKRKFGAEIMPNISKAPLKWRKTEKEITEFLSKLGHKRAIVISNKESVEDTANELGLTTNISTMSVIKIMKKDAEAKKLGFNRSISSIVEDAARKFGLDVLDKKLSPIFEGRYAMIEKCHQVFLTAEKKTTTIGLGADKSVAIIGLGSMEKHGLLALTVLETEGFDILLQTQKDFKKGDATTASQETGFERKYVTFSPQTENIITAVLTEISKLGESWHRSGNTICSHIGEPVGHTTGRSKPTTSDVIWKIITGCVEAKKTVKGNEMPVGESNHNNGSTSLQTGCLDTPAQKEGERVLAVA